MTNNILFLQIATESDKEKWQRIFRVTYDSSEKDFCIPVLKRIQFHIRVCLAITANEAQRQLFSDESFKELRHECFTHC